MWYIARRESTYVTRGATEGDVPQQFYCVVGTISIPKTITPVP